MSQTASTIEIPRVARPERWLWLWDLGCVAAGCLAVLAFAPFELRLLALPSLALLFLAVLRDTPRRAALRGLAFGFGYFGAGVSWVQVSIHQFGLPVLAFSVSATLLFVTVVALFPALFAWLARRYAADLRGWRLSLALAAFWVLTEWIRSWFCTGFPWLSIGYSQTAGVLSGYAPLGGVFAVGFLLAWSAAVPVAIAQQGSRPALLTLLLFAVWGGGWGLRQIAWTQPTAAPFPVALIQGNVPQSMKWLPSERDASIRTYLNLTEPYWGQSKLIVWPETAVPALYDQAQTLFDRLHTASQQTGSELLIGVPYRDARTGKFYNSAVGVGKTTSVYHKRHLVPFGEYMPLQSLLGPFLQFLAIPMSDFSSGMNARPVLQVAGQTLGVSICYEDVFGEEVIEALPEAGILVNISNDAWFGDSLAPHQHLQMARMRAIETGRYMLRATNTGVTAIVDPQGQLLATAAQFQATALTGTVQAVAGMTPYARGGNLPILLGVFAIAGLLLWQRHSLPGAVLR